MAAYLISRKESKLLDTVVFSAGPNNNEEAVAVFSSPACAAEYIAKANWEAEYTVATVESIPFLRWLLQAYDDGVQYLATDPDYEKQQAGERLNTLDIKGHLEHAGSHIVDVAHPDF